MTSKSTAKQTHFGFSQVDENAKQGMVRDVFANVATKYDIMNDAMSFGIHRVWKDRLINIISPKSDMHLLDVAGGTGDIAFRFLKSGGGEATLLDINENMLREGVARSIDENILQNINWSLGNAEALPFEDKSFDVYSIAFGIRNVTDINKALAEAHRVLKTGGRFVCLEFSQPKNPSFGKIYDFFSFNIIPKMGEVLANDRASYQYLVESIRKFPKQDEFKSMIENAGFVNVSYSNLTGGTVAIHSGWKI